MKIFRSIFILLIVLCLSSCSGWESYFAQNISNKHDGSLIKGKKQTPATQKQDCHQWCHNGWCTTHCEQME